MRERTDARRGDLRLDERAAARARARPDRHPGAVPGLRRLATTRCARGRRAIPTVPEGDRAGPEDARRDDGRHAHDRPGDRRARRGARPRRPPAGARRRACGSPSRRAAGVPVAALEWLDPVFVAGHWTPQLIELAGGVDVLGFAGEHSEQSTWEPWPPPSRRSSSCMPCGYDAARALRGGDALRRPSCARSARGASSRSTPSAYFSRPGPRLVDGLELLAHVLHPDRVAAPAGVAPGARRRALDPRRRRRPPGRRRRRARRRPRRRPAPRSPRAEPGPAPAVGDLRRRRRRARRRSGRRCGRPTRCSRATKLRARLKTISPPMPVCSGLSRASAGSTASAPIRPKTAPEAPTVSARGSTSRAPKEPASSEVK